jgi:hypothetical protein
MGLSMARNYFEPIKQPTWKKAYLLSIRSDNAVVMILFGLITPHRCV